MEVVFNNYFFFSYPHKTVLIMNRPVRAHPRVTQSDLGFMRRNTQADVLCSPIYIYYIINKG